MSQKLIDIAGWQHPNGAPIDWAKVVADGYVGVIIKATQGIGYVNPYFAKDYADAHAAGLLVGAFHYAKPNEGNIEAEAQHFASVTTGLVLPLGCWYDLEELGGEPWFALEQRCRDWVRLVDTPPNPAGCYTNKYYAGNLGDTPQHLPWWLANLDDEDVGISPWIVQHAAAPVAGIVGEVDQDLLLRPRPINPPGPPAPGPAPSPLGPHGEPELRQGATGSWVEDLQDRLNHAGASLKVDGNFGQLTDGAVRRLQGAQGLAVDGIVGPATWGALDRLTDAPAPAPAPQPGPAPNQPEIQRGAKGDAVRLLQQRLNLFGAGLVVDGDFGPLTEHAVRQFQASHSLVNDGIVGPLTWTVLLAG